MPLTLPDPLAAARQEAEQIKQDRHVALEARFERIIADAKQLSREQLTAGLEAFHRRRMAMVPAADKYPEAQPWVDFALARDRELQRLAALSDFELAIVRSLDLYVTFHAIRRAAARDERCRVAYLPESDRGPLTISNTDDPLTYWRPAPPLKLFPFPRTGLITGGVGSGLHLDEEPDELFPLPVLTMLGHYADDVPGAVEFLARYRPFWGRCNFLVADRQRRSAAIEKCSFKYMDVFAPGPDGRSHISGMTCRDAQTEQGRHQHAMRQEYLRLFGLPQDGPDMAFWNAARKFEDKLAAGLRLLGPRPKCDEVLRLFLARYPDGLNKWGLKPHPDSGLVGYTLQTHLLLIDERVYYRWQRSQDGTRYPAAPEVYRDAAPTTEQVPPT